MSTRRKWSLRFSRLLPLALAVAFCCSLDQASAQAPEAGLYVKRATWVETLAATRQAVQQADPRPSFQLSPWSTSGHLAAKSFDEVLFPEQGVDLAAVNAAGTPLWTTRADFTDGRVHNLPGSSRGSTYLYRTLTVPSAATLGAGLGSDDGLEIWLNDKKLLSKDVPRGPAPDQDRVVLELQPGENRILLKIHNNSGGHGFYFRIGEAADSGLWPLVERDFPVESGWVRRHLSPQQAPALLSSEAGGVQVAMLTKAIQELGAGKKRFQAELDQLVKSQADAADPRWLTLYERVCRFGYRPAEIQRLNLAALRRAIEDLCSTHGQAYPGGDEFLRRLTAIEKRLADVEMALAGDEQAAVQQMPQLLADAQTLRHEALLANPLLDFDRLLLVRRKAGRMGLPQNWQGNCAVAKTGYDNQIVVLSPVTPQGVVSTLYQPEEGRFVGDVDLHFDADRMLFSMPGSHGRWQIWEIGADGADLRQVTPGTHADVDNYDACYLPDGRIMFDSTRCFAGVPCVGGSNTVANLCLMEADGGAIRQLCFDQDHDWCPTVLNNGRVLYSRWEYSDTQHYFSRLLFQMNPDGTGQSEYYASNSLWPNSIFYSRPIPGHPTKVVSVISGHHGVPRMGEMVVFDPALGRRENQGAVQRIGDFGLDVEAKIADGLVNGSWPKFLHPYPLSDKYFLVSAQPDASSNWGLYLVDIFDNMLLIKEEPGYAMLEPVPLRETVRPPVIPPRVDLQRDDATVYLNDIYQGPGLKGVPRGTVKSLRIYSLHYAYPGMGGHINIGIDGPWDARRILGTVPVKSDGSAVFKVPANTPLAVQPLDADGRAVQLMRSWFTAMPGETLSCVGCHESQNVGPPPESRVASYDKPVEITPWHGPARGFSFKREVQPVLDQYCVGCHDGAQRSDGPPLIDFVLRDKPGWRNFTSSYVSLHPFVRRPGPESDYRMQKPMEYHASTSELIQILEKGHHNVHLDDEAWDRLVTWIDLNVPDHGSWHEHRNGHSPMEARRREMSTLYANRPEDPEAIPVVSTDPVEYIAPAVLQKRPATEVSCANWPLTIDQIQLRQEAAGQPTLSYELAPGVALEMVLVPAGQFIMGAADGPDDEYPQTVVAIEKPFYVGKFEVTNEQFAQFDPDHESAYISLFNKDRSTRGMAANGPRQPVIRVTWEQVNAFCRWLSDKTGRVCSLPTESQWEYACRAGSDTPLAYGQAEVDFGSLANLADSQLDRLCPRDSPKWIPNVDAVNDGAAVAADVGRYAPNALGIHDMHGNVAEWTADTYVAYPYDTGAHRATSGRKSVRGGSWYDRPERARSSFRAAYQPWQPVFNVGFRVVMAAEQK